MLKLWKKLATVGLVVGTAISARGMTMTDFFEDCGYGVAIGAGIGGLTVVTSTNPSSNLPNIAKGASLGLYAGILFALAVDAHPKSVGPSTQETSRETPVERTHFWIDPGIGRNPLLTGSQASALQDSSLGPQWISKSNSKSSSGAMAFISSSF